jgi:hypothetical protein
MYLMDDKCVDDTVKALIVPTDLYSIIRKEKDAQYALYKGFGEVNAYETMQALSMGKPQRRLETSRLAREIVKVFLSRVGQIHICGKEGRSAWEASTRFMNYSDDEISKMLTAMIKEDGLLDVNCVLFIVFIANL